MKKYSDDFSGRIRIVGILLLAVAILIVYRLFSIQVLSSGYYKNEANNQYLNSQNKSPIADRGNIYFKEKNQKLISAAVVKEGFYLSINPSILKNAEDSYEKIASIIPIDREDFLTKAKKTNSIFEIIIHKVEANSAEKIKKLSLSGISLIPEQWRFYPGGNLASHILGFVGYNGNELAGQYGIEKSFEKYLKGIEQESIRDSFANAFLGLKKGISFSYSRKDIVLTIEPTVQKILENSLEKIVEKYFADGAGGIIIEPSTGKILAMAAKPDFDSNFYGKTKNQSLFLNPLVSSIFEMGSIVKPITISSALNEGKINAETTYFDNGYLIINNERIENYDGKGRGKTDMQMVLNESLNTGAVFAMRSLGKESFKKYIIDFGFSEKTGIELPDEIKGNTERLDSPREIEYATASFGQGISITPIAFVGAFSALANGGFLVQPYIIDDETKSRPIIRRQILKKETSEEISRMLSVVVDKALLGGTVKVEHYTMAAKTGTAQMAIEGKRGYQEGSYLHTFVGYAPAFDAKFLVFLFLKNPKDVKYASHSLTPPFMDIMKFLLNYYEVSPDR